MESMAMSVLDSSQFEMEGLPPVTEVPSMKYSPVPAFQDHPGVLPGRMDPPPPVPEPAVAMGSSSQGVVMRLPPVSQARSVKVSFVVEPPSTSPKRK